MSPVETSTEYDVTGMSCGHCEVAIREEVSAVPGVEGIEVSAETGRLVVKGGSIDEAAVIAAVDDAGYSAERAGITGGSTEEGSCCGSCGTDSRPGKAEQA